MRAAILLIVVGACVIAGMGIERYRTAQTSTDDGALMLINGTQLWCVPMVQE